MAQTPGAILEIKLIKLRRLQVHLTHVLVDADLQPSKRRKIYARMLELDEKRRRCWRRHRAGRATPTPSALTRASRAPRH
jgi:hypothetical protein